MRRWPYALGLGAVLLAACSGPGNSGRIVIGDLLAMQVPWVKGRAPVVEAGSVVIPNEPIYPPIATGMEDPGSTGYDCEAQEGLEFSSVWFEDFEAEELYPNSVGVAAAWASHDDSSEGAFRVPGEANWYPGLLGRHGAAWGLPAERVENAPRCHGEKNEWVLHYRAGRFNRFGGGMGHPMAELVPCPTDTGNGTPDDGLCPPQPQPGDVVDAAGLPLTAPDGKPYAQVHSFWDVSGFDGIAFWARRGPEGQNSFSVGIFDKYTSDDLARQNEKYCRRLRECRTQCVNREPCSPVNPGDADTVYRCFDPEVGLPQGIEDSLLNELYPACGSTACTFPETYPDPDFEGKECQPYTFQAHETGEFCFDPGDLPPPENGERCGDGYGKDVQLTLDWKFYKVPFRELRQYGHGKVSPEMDLTTISNVIFVTSKGWVDFYLDNVTFYREAK